VRLTRQNHYKQSSLEYAQQENAVSRHISGAKDGHTTSMRTLSFSTQTSENRAMANDATAVGQSAGNWPEVRSGPLMVGGILIGIGALVALAGMAVAGTHAAMATRAWLKDLETPPDQLARLRWEQAKTAMAAGATTWREHPNAQVHLTHRDSSTVS
jgi:hypothetical protein